MGLITRTEKGSKLTIEEMDNNLLYLESTALSGGTGGGIVEKTYQELYNLWNTSTLVSGQTYLMTDYQTVHTIPNTSDLNEGPIEPLVITANSNETFNPICYSPYNPFDVIYYDIENNFEIVDGCTKGYIYRRIDTKQRNDIGCDFRNVKFRRWQIEVTDVWVDGDTYGVGNYVIPNIGDNRIYISLTNNNISSIYDTSNWVLFPYNNLDYISISEYTYEMGYNIFFNVNAGNYTDYNMWANYTQSTTDNIINSGQGSIIENLNNVIFTQNFYNNTINGYFNGNNIGSNSNEIEFYNNIVNNGLSENLISGSFYNNNINQNFNNNILINEFSYNTINNNQFYNNTINSIRNCEINGGNYNTFIGDCSYSVLGDNFQNNIIGNGFSRNVFGDNVVNNYFQGGNNDNIFGNSINNNIFSGGTSNITTGDSFNSNIFEYGIMECIFGDNCSGNTISNGGSYNKFGNNCMGNSMIGGSNYNTFGNDCRYNILQNGANYNNFGNDCRYNILQNGSQYNKFGDVCSYNSFINSSNYNNFGNSCSNNTLTNSSSHNTFGFGCRNNTLGDSCIENVFGANCINNVFGNGFMYIILDNFISETDFSYTVELYNKVYGHNIKMLNNDIIEITWLDEFYDINIIGVEPQPSTTTTTTNSGTTTTTTQFL